MKKPLLELLLLLFITSLFIFFQFNKIPNKLSYDEVEFANLAKSLNNKPYSPYSLLATGHSTLYFYVILLSFKLFGQNNFGLRFPSAFFGVLNILLFYLMMHQVLKKLKSNDVKNKFFSCMPFFLSIILASSRWYFNFARFSFEATFLIFLELTSILFLFTFLKNKKSRFLSICAVFTGLTFHSYYPGRIFFLLPVFTLLSHLNKFRIRALVIFLSIFILICSPLFLYFITGKDLRIQEQFFIKDNKISTLGKIGYLSLNGLKLTLMPTAIGDMNGRHNYPGKPMFNPVLGAFYIFGLFVTLIRFKDFYNQFFLLYFVLSLIPAMLTYPWENPNALRTISSIVPSIYFIGNGIVYLLKSKIDSAKSYSFILGVIILMFIFSTFYETRTYFLFQKNVFNQAFEFPGGLQKILSLKLWERMHYE